MARTKREPAPPFSSRVPQAPARVLVVTPAEISTEAFAHLMLTCGLGCERIYRARSPDDAAARQAAWAARGITSSIVRLRTTGHTAPTEGNDHE